MATDILVTDVTNGDISTNTDGDLVWQGTGVFDKFMEAFNKNIDIQYKEDRIKGQDYANVYLGAIQTAMQQALQFILQEQLLEAQIDGIKADNLLKAKQLEIAEKELQLKILELDRLKDLTEAELEKNWGYDVTRDSVTGELILGNSTGNGKIDKEIIKLTKDSDLTSTTTLKVAKETNDLMPVQIDNIIADNSLKNRQILIAEKELKLKEFELNRQRDLTEAELEKHWGYNVTRDTTTGELIFGNSTNNGKIDKEITKLVKDSDLTTATKFKVDKETDKLQEEVRILINKT